LRDALPEIRRLGAELVVVGNGRPEHAADFRDSEGIEHPLYVDPEMRAYAAAGLRRGVASSLGLRTFRHAIRAWRSGKRQEGVQGDPWQQGGCFVIRPDGRVVYAQVSREAGDHADPDEIIGALESEAG
jgi:peroxiredoxin